MSASERVTVRVPKRLLERVDDRVEAGEFANRSEAFREATRRAVLESEVHERLLVEDALEEVGQ